jgi:hypothetical protein
MEFSQRKQMEGKKKGGSLEKGRYPRGAVCGSTFARARL